jgi:hypothetical protein
VDRARLFRVDVVRFDPAGNIQREAVPRTARLVVVSTYVTLSVLLQMNINGLHSNRLLRWIFIDECHTIYTECRVPCNAGGTEGHTHATSSCSP